MNDEKLILYYYGDGLSDAERQSIAKALQGDSAAAAKYAELCRDLDQLSHADPVEMPAHLRQQLHDSVNRVARPVLVSRGQPRRSFGLMSFVWGSTVAAALAIGIGIGVFLGGNDTGPDASANDAFARGMQVYLREARQDIVSMPVSTGADRVRLLMHIVEQNRLFERAAEQNGSHKLARVLRAFEPLLLQLAADDLPPATAASLRSQLSFELNVMLTKLSRKSSNQTHST
jgi:hypothetical protein